MTSLLVFLALVAVPEPELRWHNVAQLRVEGKGWSDTAHPFDRLPAKAKGVVRDPVWSLSEDSAGMHYRFVTDATVLHARWKVRDPKSLALPHMPATGVSGLDLYVRQGEQWRWVGAGRPLKPDLNEGPLVSGLEPGTREFLLYLPLYNGVDSVEIGLPAGASFSQPPPRWAGRKPIVLYGTSILQGGCASRPGMAYPAILGRMFDWPTINLGFSGNAKSEPEMARLLAELDPAVYVLDSLPNLEPAEVAERVEPFIRTIREARPKTPIVLIENVTYTNASFLPARSTRVQQSNAHLRAIYKKLKAAGDPALYYVGTANLFGRDGEDTVDGSHPTDLGFLRMAGGIAPTLKQALGRK